MKKVAFAFILLTLICTTSCKKTSSASGNSWTFKGTTYNVYSCLGTGSDLDASSASPTNLSNFGTLTATFPITQNLPTTSGTYTVVNNVNSTSGNKVAFVLTTGGNNPVSYYSTGGNGSNETVQVTVSGGNVSISGSGIEVQNINMASDSATVGMNITQTY